MKTRDVLHIWAIFRHPSGKGFLANRCEIHKGNPKPVETMDIRTGESIDTLRERFRKEGFVLAGPLPGDQPNLIEYWL
jgi:hypothetical protein